MRSVNRSKTKSPLFRWWGRRRGFAAAFGASAVVLCSQTATDAQPPPSAPLETEGRAPAPAVVLGDPVEVRGYTIIPVVSAAVGVGNEPAPGQGDSASVRGGVVAPVGLIVLTDTSIELLPIRKGMLTQLLEAAGPVMAELQRGDDRGVRRGAEEATGWRALTAVMRLLDLAPEQGLRFGIIPWPPRLLVLFFLGWVGLSILLAALFTPQLEVLADYARSRPLPSLGLGLVVIAVLVTLGGVLLLSVVGIPVVVVVFLLGSVLKLFGLTGLAQLVGRPLAGAHSVLATLLGAVAISVVGFVPYVGWIVWTVLSVVAVGACSASRFGTRRFSVLPSNSDQLAKEVSP